MTHLVSHGRRNPRRRWYLLVAVLGLAGLVGVGVAVLRPRPTSGAPGGHPAGAARGDLIFHRLADPDRTEVDGPDGRRIAVFTDDYGQLARYREADAALGAPAAGENRVVFFGDSITDGWRLDEAFPGKPYVNRGIGGQTTEQIVLRMRPDALLCSRAPW